MHRASFEENWWKSFFGRCMPFLFFAIVFHLYSLLQFLFAWFNYALFYSSMLSSTFFFTDLKKTGKQKNVYTIFFDCLLHSSHRVERKANITTAKEQQQIVTHIEWRREKERKKRKTNQHIPPFSRHVSEWNAVNTRMREWVCAYAYISYAAYA